MNTTSSPTQAPGRLEIGLAAFSALASYAGWILTPLVGRAGLATSHAGWNRLTVAVVWAVAAAAAGGWGWRRFRRGAGWRRAAVAGLVQAGWGLCAAGGGFGI